MSTWMQIKFEDVTWFNEKMSKPKTLETEPAAKTQAMVLGFLSSKLTGEKKPFGDLLTCLIKASSVTMVNTIGRSMYLGPGSKKCSFILPRSIVIPTDIRIPLGTTEIPLMHQEIRVSQDRYYMTLGMKVKAAVMSAAEADLLYGSKPKEFIGYIDCCQIPEGALAKTEAAKGEVPRK